MAATNTSENNIHEMLDYKLPDPDMLKAEVNEGAFDGNEQEKVSERLASFVRAQKTEVNNVWLGSGADGDL